MIPVNKLMIVDDDELSNYITGKIVEHAGLAEKADSFYSAKAALKYLKTNSSMRQGDYPDLIFLDLNLYDMKGWDFLSEYIKLKENYRRKITLFLLTNSIAEKDREQAKQFPCIKGYLQKPLTMGMIQEIELYLTRKNDYVYRTQ
jgi:CheY-like chemotaxis protein